MLRLSDICFDTNERLYQRHMMNDVANVFITLYAFKTMFNFNKMYPK